jgi:hypothetical protein
MTLEYNKHWDNAGIWPAIREFRSNAQDSGAFEYMRIEDNNLIIKDNGSGIPLSCLLLGEHESGEGTIGQFGEGLKIAILVMIRNNHPINIYTNNLHIWGGVGEMFGKEVLRINWEDSDFVSGTKVVIGDWTEDTDYSGNFLFDNEEDPDSRVIDRTDAGMILDDCKLYSKGVFVNNLTGYAFGYNISTITMNRDRSAISEEEVYSAVGKIWGSCESSWPWKQYFNSTLNTSDPAIERMIRLASGMTDKARSAMIKGFVGSQGENACIKTSDEDEREAKHRGAKVVDLRGFSSSMISWMAYILDTDTKFIERHGGRHPNKVNKLSKKQKDNLSLCKKIAKRAECEFEVVAAENMPQGMGGLCDYSNNTIWIEHNQLEDALTSGSIMIHELGHWKYYTSDMTEAHDNSVCKIGVIISGLLPKEKED